MLSSSYAKLESDSGKVSVKKLKKRILQQTSCIFTFVKSNNSQTEASYRVAYNLGVAGMSYSAGEVTKRCIMDTVRCVHLGKETNYSSIPLTRVSATPSM